MSQALSSARRAARRADDAVLGRVHAARGRDRPAARLRRLHRLLPDRRGQGRGLRRDLPGGLGTQALGLWPPCKILVEEAGGRFTDLEGRPTIYARLRAGDERTPHDAARGAAPPLTLAIHPGALGDVLLAIPALRVLRQARPERCARRRGAAADRPAPRDPRCCRSLGRLRDARARCPLSAMTRTGGPRGMAGALCADDLRRATRVVAWIGSREPRFVKRLTGLVPGSVVAPSVERRAPGLGAPRGARVGAIAMAGDHAIRAARFAVPAAARATRRDASCVHHGWNEKRPPAVRAPRGRRAWASDGRRRASPPCSSESRRCRVLRSWSIRGRRMPSAVAALPERLTARAMRLREPPLPLLAGSADSRGRLPRQRLRDQPSGRDGRRPVDRALRRRPAESGARGPKHVEPLRRLADGGGRTPTPHE